MMNIIAEKTNKLMTLSTRIKPLSNIINNDALPLDARKKLFETRWLPLSREMDLLEREIEALSKL